MTGIEKAIEAAVDEIVERYSSRDYRESFLAIIHRHVLPHVLPNPDQPWQADCEE